MYYILDEEGRVIGSADGPVDQTDLKSRSHVALASDLDLGVELVEAQGRGPARSIVRKSVLQPSRIELATSAKDSDGDGVPELPANGKSKTTITATLKHPSDKLVKEKVKRALPDLGGRALSQDRDQQRRHCLRRADLESRNS